MPSLARAKNSRILLGEHLEPRRLLAAQPMITEFVADNDGGIEFADGSTPDWIEIYNAGDESLDLEGHFLTDDPEQLQRWRLPSASVDPGGYLVVFASGRDEVDSQGNLHADFRLSADGEYVALVSPMGQVLSEVNVSGNGYPRQLSEVSFGIAESEQLVSSLSQATWWVPSSNDLGLTWTLPDFDAAENGFSSGLASLGFENEPDKLVNFTNQFRTELPNRTHAVFVRTEFEIPDVSGITTMLLRLKYNNGFVAYLNGVEVARDRAPDDLSWYAQAELPRRRDHQALAFEEFDLSNDVALLREGTNVLAIHALNRIRDVDDLLLVPELFVDQPLGKNELAYLGTPTPGARNFTVNPFAGPLIGDVTQNPGALEDDQDIVISARVRPLNNPIDAVDLAYRTMYGDEVVVPMADDGVGFDQAAGDGVYSAHIPSDASNPGEMVRWRVSALDTIGNSMLWPLHADPSDSEEYYGTIVSDPTIQTNLDTLHWFVERPDNANREDGTRGSLFYHGRFYDNVRFDLHGYNAVRFPKKSYDVDFNNENRFHWQEGELPVRDVNLISNWSDKGKFRTSLSYDIYREAGAPYMFSVPVRIQQNGEFFSIADMVEDADDITLARLGLNPEGALYKPYDGLITVNQSEKKTRKWEDNSDLQSLIEASRRRGDDFRNFAYDNLDIPSIVNYLTIFDIISGYDCCHREYYVYQDTGGTNEWQFLPWDVDMSFGHGWRVDGGSFNDELFYDYGPQGGWNNQVLFQLYKIPEFFQTYYRRLRTNMDQFLQTADTPDEELYFERRLDEFLALMDPNSDGFPLPAQGTDDADLDYHKWGSWDHGNGSKAHASRGETMREHIERVKGEFLPDRREYLYAAVDEFGFPVIPDPQIGNPDLRFGLIETNPTDGNLAEGFVELANDNDFAVDISGWQINGTVEFTFPAGTVIPRESMVYIAADKNAFRARAEGPSGGQGLFIVGGYQSSSQDDQNTIALVGADGNVVQQRGVILGDSNFDRQFNQLDLVQVLQSAKYETQQAATLAEGDWNSDGLFNHLDIVVVLVSVTYVPSQQAFVGIDVGGLAKQEPLKTPGHENLVFAAMH